MCTDAPRVTSMVSAVKQGALQGNQAFHIVLLWWSNMQSIYIYIHIHTYCLIE